MVLMIGVVINEILVVSCVWFIFVGGGLIMCFGVVGGGGGGVCVVVCVLWCVEGFCVLCL